MKLYEIANQYRDAMDNIEVDENGELLNADQLEAVDGAFDDKAEAVAVYIKELSCFVAALKDEKKENCSRGWRMAAFGWLSAPPPC